MLVLKMALVSQKVPLPMEVPKKKLAVHVPAGISVDKREARNYRFIQ
jgi:hypothetical protein